MLDHPTAGHQASTRCRDGRPSTVRRALVALLVLPLVIGPGAAQTSTTQPNSAGTPAPESPASRSVSTSGSPDTDAVSDAAAMSRFLDRLMLAESGGRDDARNPRSTALGPFQFIESTFLAVAQRHFDAETKDLSQAQILKLRTNRSFARRAAEAFTRDNAAQLAAAGLPATFANLRLAFLAGAGGAIRVLQSDPHAPVIRLLGPHVVQANPFMAGMKAEDLAAWSARNLAATEIEAAEVAADPSRLAKLGRGRAARPAVAVRCNRALASCRRWVALATQRLTKRKIASGRGRDRKR